MHTPPVNTNHETPHKCSEKPANQTLAHSLYTDQELLIDGHLQAAMSELRAAARLADKYYPEQSDHPARTGLNALMASYDTFLTGVSTRNLQAAIAQAAITKADITKAAVTQAESTIPIR